MFTVSLKRENGLAIDDKVFYTVDALNNGLKKAIEEDKHNVISGWTASHDRNSVAMVLFKEKAEELNLTKMSPDDVLTHERGFVQLFGDMQQLERSFQSLSRREEGPDRINQVVIIAPESNPKLLGKNLTEVRDVVSDKDAVNNITKN